MSPLVKDPCDELLDLLHIAKQKQLISDYAVFERPYWCEVAIDVMLLPETPPKIIRQLCEHIEDKYLAVCYSWTPEEIDGTPIPNVSPRINISHIHTTRKHHGVMP